MALLPDTFAELNLRAGDFDAARRQSQRMADDAGHLVRAHVLDRIEEREHAAEMLVAQATYSAALAQLVAE